MEPIRLSPINCLAAVPNTPLVLAGGDSFSLINAATGHGQSFPTINRMPTLATDSIASYHISANGNIVTLWDAATNQPNHSSASTDSGIKDVIQSVAFVTPKVAVSGGNNCTLHLHDFRTQHSIFSLKVASDSINTVMTDTGTPYTVFCSANDGTLAAVDFRNDSKLAFACGSPVIDFALEKSTIITLTESGSVSVIDTSSKEIVNEYKVGKPFVYCIKMDYKDGQLVVGSETSSFHSYTYSYGGIGSKNMILPAESYTTMSRNVPYVKILDNLTVAVGNDGILYRWA